MTQAREKAKVLQVMESPLDQKSSNRSSFNQALQPFLEHFVLQLILYNTGLYF